MNIFQQISITYVLVFIVFALVRLILATVVSGTADRKGYHAIAWFLFGFFGGFVISFVIISSLPNKNKTDEKLDMELLLLYKKCMMKN